MPHSETTPSEAIGVLVDQARAGTLTVDAVATVLEQLSLTIIASDETVTPERATVTPERAAGALWRLADALRCQERSGRSSHAGA